MKKGQIETMGLVIIVILLVFIAIFALSFMIKPKPLNEDLLKVKTDALRSSVLKTTLCNRIDVKKELENLLDGYSECNYNMDDVIKSIIENSLEPNEGYSFKAGSLVDLNTCSGRDKITAVQQNIGDGENVEVALCRR